MKQMGVNCIKPTIYLLKKKICSASLKNNQSGELRNIHNPVPLTSPPVAVSFYGFITDPSCLKIFKALTGKARYQAE